MRTVIVLFLYSCLYRTFHVCFLLSVGRGVSQQYDNIDVDVKGLQKTLADIDKEISKANEISEQALEAIEVAIGCIREGRQSNGVVPDDPKNQLHKVGHFRDISFLDRAVTHICL